MPRLKRVITRQRTLRNVRLDAGISMRDLEERTGISRAYLSRIERGTLVPLSGHREALEDALGVRLTVAVVLLEDDA